MRRRTLLIAASPLIAPVALVPPAAYGQVAGLQDPNQADGGGNLDQAVQSFLNLPGQRSFLIQAGSQGSLGQIAHNPTLQLFTASAFKTFVLGAYLRAVENGLLDEDAQSMTACATSAARSCSILRERPVRARCSKP